MPNAAILAARLTGQPLLMLPSEAEAYAAQLVERAGADGRGGFSGLLSAARRAAVRAPAPSIEGPSCYYPGWLARGGGVADGGGFGWSLKDGVALVEISGPLMAHGFVWDGEVWINGYDTLSQTFEEIAADDRVRGVFISFCSPGGVSHTGLGALADQIRGMRAAAGGKPVYGWADMACSAAYWLASACDRLFAGKLAQVGSIGALRMHCDQSGALDQQGFKVTYVQFGEHKTEGNPNQPLSAWAKDDWQADMNYLGDLIVSAVVAGRPNLTPEAVLATGAAVFYAEAPEPARSGLALGLVDAIASENEAFAALLAVLPTSNPAPGADSASMETEMKRSDLEAILADASLTTEDALRAKLQAALEADAQQASGDDPDDDGDTDAEGDGDPDAEDDKKEDPEDDDAMTAPAGQTVLAILDLPEASGREKLARALAGQAGMTVDTAKTLLAAAPKASRLSERMIDPAVTADGGGAALSAEAKASAFVLDSLAAAQGRK
jgi:ClpP class serine protease